MKCLKIMALAGLPFAVISLAATLTIFTGYLPVDAAADIHSDLHSNHQSQQQALPVSAQPAHASTQFNSPTQTYNIAFGGALGFRYQPASLNIHTGDTVTWSGSFSSHPLVSDNNLWPTPNTGTTFSFTFTTAGTYNYHCQFHGAFGMIGSIVVTDYPVPAISALYPSSATVGDPDLTLTVDGSNFTAATTVLWGSTIYTPSVAPTTTTRLQVTIPASEFTANRTVDVTVSNPQPGGPANTTLPFTINTTCDFYAVTKTDDNNAAQCGTLRGALTHPVSSPIVFSLAPPSTITLTAGNISIPAAAHLIGICTSTGPGITIIGSGSTAGLNISGGITIFGLRFAGFKGPQLVFTGIGQTGNNQLACSAVAKTYP